MQVTIRHSPKRNAARRRLGLDLALADGFE